MSTGQVQIGILKTGVVLDSSSTVRYLNGNCTWTVTTTFGNIPVVGTSEGPELPLDGDDNVITFQCEVNGSVKLSAFTTAYGESCSYLSTNVRSFALKLEILSVHFALDDMLKQLAFNV